MKLTHDEEIEYAFAQEFNSTNWVTVKSKWSEFVDRLSKSKKTSETAKQYAKLDSTEKNKIKAVGGFVGGVFAGPSRTKNTLLYRTMLTLDIDMGNFDIETFKMMYDFASVIYSTHSHTLETPSYRIVIPLLTTIDGDQFEYIARKITNSLGGKEFFCKTSYVRHQLMYLPSHPSDVEPIFEVQDGLWLDPAEYLVDDWQDMSQWTLDEIRGLKKQEDPLKKTGRVGIFCRTYDIHEAIAKYIPEYVQSDFNKDVYTYTKGSTANGVKLYDDKFSYSHHSSDPVSGRTSNAFDLVRIHKFGHEDENTKENTAGNKMPSYVLMMDLMDKDPKCRTRTMLENQEALKVEFSEKYIDETGEIIKKPEAGETKSKKKGFTQKKPHEDDIKLMNDKIQVVKGVVIQSRQNILIIFEHDRNLKGMIRYDEFTHVDLVSQLPWRKVTMASNTFTDMDHSCLRRYFELWYGIDNAQKVQDAFNEILNRNHFHPVREYLNDLIWDGKERLESLFIDYLGAEDSLYVRTVTRKMFLAAISRIFQPGIKFDTMLVFVGPQGKGKSWLVGKMGGKWFSDTLGNIHSKEAMESLQGVWLLEVGELSQFKRADVEAVKGFISKPVDRFRPSYGRTTANYPRQCIFFGSTNEVDFLIDQTGNRRYWPVDVSEGVASKSIANDLTKSEVDQIWAEALELYNFTDEELILNESLAADALKAQEQFTQRDDREDYIRNFLELKLPAEWDEMSMWDRRGYIDGDGLYEKGTVERTQVSVHEIWIELMKEDKAKMTPNNTKYIHQVMRKMEGWKQIKGKRRVKGHGSIRVYERIQLSQTK